MVCAVWKCHWANGGACCCPKPSRLTPKNAGPRGFEQDGRTTALCNCSSRSQPAPYYRHSCRQELAYSKLNYVNDAMVQDNECFSFFFVHGASLPWVSKLLYLPSVGDPRVAPIYCQPGGGSQHPIARKWRRDSSDLGWLEMTQDDSGSIEITNNETFLDVCYMSISLDSRSQGLRWTH